MKCLRVILLTLILPAIVFATTHYVNPDGTGDHPSIQEAIHNSADGDIILLTDGTFTGPDNRNLDYMGKAITIESESGDPELCIIDCEASNVDPHRAFFFHRSEGSNSVLRGVKITNGYMVSEYGGAILIYGDATPTIEHCLFTGNYAQRGGAIAVHDGDGSPQIRHCDFIGNSGDDGGAFFCVGWSAEPILESCHFETNTASSGGALYADVGGPDMTDCNFHENTASSGGAIYFIDIFTHSSMTGCRFIGNSANSAGAIMVNEGSPSIVSCLFAFNTNTNSYYSGAIVASDWEWGTPIVNTTFAYNVGPEASVITLRSHYELPIDNCIFAFNEGTSVIGCPNEGQPTLVCTDVYGNLGGDWVGCITDQEGIHDNFSADPMFCDVDLFDFQLHLSSPCLPENSPCGELVGAYGQGCGDTATLNSSWSAIKTLY